MYHTHRIYTNLNSISVIYVRVYDKIQYVSNIAVFAKGLSILANFSYVDSFRYKEREREADIKKYFRELKILTMYLILIAIKLPLYVTYHSNNMTK